MKISIKNVTNEDRARQDYGDVKELANSLLEYGFIHPIALNKELGVVAGGRRFTALKYMWENRSEFLKAENVEASMQRFLESGMLELGKHYTSKEDADVDQCSEMELEENVRRKNFTWKEEVIAIFKIHKRNRVKARERSEKWGMRETGRLLNVSGASVSYAVKLYECLQDPEHPVHECFSATDAINKLAQMRAAEARQEAVRRNVLETPEDFRKHSKKSNELGLDELAEGLDSTEVELEEISVGADGQINTRPIKANLRPDMPDTTIIESNEEESEPPIVIDTSKFMCGSMEDLYKVGSLPKGFFNHILTDPPYGIDMKNLQYKDTGGKNVNRISNTHKVGDNVSSFGKWLEIFYHVMKDDGFCIMWCDAVHFNELRVLAEQVGFKAQRWPFVWCKSHQCMNQQAQYNFTKNFEIALVLRKGAATLVEPQSSSYYIGSSQNVRKRLSNHPFVKPFDLWMTLAKAIAIEGESILDPFAGVGSMPIALLEKYDVYSCEVDEDIYNEQLSNIMNFYSEIYPNAKFVK